MSARIGIIFELYYYYEENNIGSGRCASALQLLAEIQLDGDKGSVVRRDFLKWYLYKTNRECGYVA